MVTETKKVIAIAALIVATGVAGVELTRNPAQADPMLVPGGAAGYAGARVDDAFKVVAEMPPVAPLTIPMAAKGDLVMPVGCAGPFKADVAAECFDTAYEVPSEEPGVVVETRLSDSSILVRMMGYTMAVFEDEAAPVSE